MAAGLDHALSDRFIEKLDEAKERGWWADVLAAEG